MEEIIKNIRINQLFDVYGSLLTEKQQLMIRLYYLDDLSLGEISIEEGISRNGVYDTLKKSIAIMEGYEDKLHLIEKTEALNSLLNDLKKINNKEVNEIVRKIESKVK